MDEEDKPLQKFKEKTLRTENIFNGQIISLQVDDVQLPNGKTSKREIIKHDGAVAIIAITDDDKILFVEQYRKPLERSLIEIPAGKLEENEKPEITAVRELEEETGYTTDDLTFVTSFYTSPGFANELMYIYQTNAVQALDTPIPGDDDEFVEVIELTLDEALRYVKTGRIQDAKTNYAILYLQFMMQRK